MSSGLYASQLELLSSGELAIWNENGEMQETRPDTKRDRLVISRIEKAKREV